MEPRDGKASDTRPAAAEKGVTESQAPALAVGRRPFVEPRLTRHEPLTRITLVSGNDFPGSGGAGGTFFGS